MNNGLTTEDRPVPTRAAPKPEPKSGRTATTRAKSKSRSKTVQARRPRASSKPTAAAAINREIGDEALAAKTGRTWSQWLAALDADGCRAMDHKAIAQHVHEKYSVGDWWSQMVTVGYERLAGLRARHQKSDGFAATASRTIAADLAALYRAWSHPHTRRRWLGDERITIRTAAPDKSMRLTWSDGRTHVDVNFSAKGPGKSQVAIQHRKLAAAGDVEKIKRLWNKRLDALRTMLEK